MLTVDDSTSMLFDFLPDYVIGLYCRDGTGKMNALCGSFDSNFDLSAINHGRYRTAGYIFQQYGFPYPAFDTAFDTSGPGAGCDTTTIATSTCSGGINPGASPGLATYPNPAGPPPGKSPKAGLPYEYWTLWPAPVHNSALNHLYYNPILTYDPAVRSDATSYPQMTAANTTNWTRVPADAWAPTIQYVDLTASVTVGQWCNSDWTQGNNLATGTAFATDPAFCRINGLVAAASSGAPAADGDYTYPWAWPGGTALKDPKYFYQNDNILWCDTVATPQTCSNGGQTCNLVSQTCGGGTPQTCGGGTAQTCNNVLAQTCVGGGNQVCNTYTQVCNTVPQTCNVRTQTCQGGGTQTCNNIQTQTCQGAGAQTCQGAGAQTCGNITTQVCSGYIASQTCANITSVCTPAPPSSCTSDWSPPGCNITCAANGSAPECASCGIVTSCPPPTCVNQGSCSGTGATCTAANAASVCAPVMGACSKDGSACTSSAQCPASGKCSSTGNTCTAADAATTCPAVNGKCSITNASCTAANAATACPVQSGSCSRTGATCASTADCPASGRCSQTNATCTAANAATDVPGAERPVQHHQCDLHGGQRRHRLPAAGQLQRHQCHVHGGQPGRRPARRRAPAASPETACTAANAATACPTGGFCSLQTTRTCTAANASTRCLPQNGACSDTGNSCTAANAATNCPPQGSCSITGNNCTAANVATRLPQPEPDLQPHRRLLHGEQRLVQVPGAEPRLQRRRDGVHLQFAVQQHRHLQRRHGQVVQHQRRMRRDLQRDRRVVHRRGRGHLPDRAGPAGLVQVQRHAAQQLDDAARGRERGRHRLPPQQQDLPRRDARQPLQLSERRSSPRR